MWQQSTQVPWSLDWEPTSQLKIPKSSKLILKLRLWNLFRSQTNGPKLQLTIYSSSHKSLELLQKTAKCVCSKWVLDAGNSMQLWKAQNPRNNLYRGTASQHAWISRSVWFVMEYLWTVWKKNSCRWYFLAAPS
jgi:hypothetical protein